VIIFTYLNIHSDIIAKKKEGKKLLSVLIDPDKTRDEKSMLSFLMDCEKAKVDYLFLGGSLLTEAKMDHTIRFIKGNCQLPVILFPGDVMQVHPKADALLFLSLISGRNADLLIGKHVVAAPIIKQIGIETLSTGYMLVDCGKPTTASYISQTLPIPYEKHEIAGVTAMTGEMLGMKLIYADGGSGAEKPIDVKMIEAIRKNINIPLIIGGGIRDLTSAEKAWDAGADVVVIGTAFEKKPESILEFYNRK
jgi:putative glycerol-1-phosphate prenyltransferase